MGCLPYMGMSGWQGRVGGIWGTAKEVFYIGFHFGFCVRGTVGVISAGVTFYGGSLRRLWAPHQLSLWSLITIYLRSWHHQKFRTLSFGKVQWLVGHGFMSAGEARISWTEKSEYGVHSAKCDTWKDYFQILWHMPCQVVIAAPCIRCQSYYGSYSQDGEFREYASSLAPKQWNYRINYNMHFTFFFQGVKRELLLALKTSSPQDLHHRKLGKVSFIGHSLLS